MEKDDDHKNDTLSNYDQFIITVNRGGNGVMG